MAAKKFQFIDKDLAWCEKVLAEWQSYVNAHPFNTLEDRWGKKLTSTGGVTHIIVASIEQQSESLRKTMRDIEDLLARINFLREAEAGKEEMKGKGGISLPPMMRNDEEDKDE